jgi:hypothetical protein
VGDLNIQEMSDALTFDHSAFRMEEEYIVFEAVGLRG